MFLLKLLSPGFFSWCAACTIDFHRKVDPICKHQHIYDIGNDTHTSLSARQTNSAPIEVKNVAEAPEPIPHFGYDCVFMFQKPTFSEEHSQQLANARLHLKSYCDDVH